MNFLINEYDDGERLDVFLSKNINDFTRSYIKKIIEQEHVTLNKKIIKSPSKKIKTNDSILINLIIPNVEKLLPSKIK